MNYLAHAFLSGPDPDVLLGNMMGDAIKGYSFLEKYPRKISSGILLHRFIDDYMDHHELTRAGKKRIWKTQRHFAGVVMDMYYDHFLAKNWQIVTDKNFEEFSLSVYQVLKDNRHQLPTETQYITDHMITHNWFGNYHDLGGLQRTLQGLSGRTKFSNNMANAVDDLVLHYGEYEQEFLTFFEDIRLACERQLKIFESYG